MPRGIKLETYRHSKITSNLIEPFKGVNINYKEMVNNI